MTDPIPYTTIWQELMDVLSRVVTLRGDSTLPVILSSLPELPEREQSGPRPSLVQGPPGRNIALAIGLRAARPDIPLLLIMNADSVTLGTNHLIHAARRNVGMTLLLLRSEVMAATNQRLLDRMSWNAPYYQPAVESAPMPLEWVTALDAAFVARGSLFDREHLATLICDAIDTPGFSIIGVTAGADLELGVLSRNTEWPEYFAAYRQWAASYLSVAVGKNLAASEPTLPKPAHSVPRHEIRMAGLGGQGVKLAGTILSEAAGLYEGLWTTMRGEYGSATRGGPSMVDVVFGSAPITYPGADRPDLLVVLSRDACERYAGSLKPNAYLIADPEQVDPMPAHALPIPIVALAREYTGRPIAAGVVSLGCVAALLDSISLDSLRESVKRHVPHRMIEKNLLALEAGYAAAYSMGGSHEQE